MAQSVLIVENDHGIRDIVTWMLEEEGYEVSVAEPSFPATFPVDDVDLILLDEWYNEKQGDMLCQEIKQIHQLQHIPVIIFSTAPDIEEIAEKCKADGFVRKPFNFDDLLSEIEKCMPAGTT